jgi:uncharacterized Ntn-hydrolase superfamily protein
MTFSIVAWDGDTPDGAEWGVAVASKFLAVGSVVPWARAKVGAVATQALANVAYGPDGLAALGEHRTAVDVVRLLTAADEDREHRQLGVVDAAGGAETYTGSECLPWAGGIAGPGFAAQGNILIGPEVVDLMVEAFTVAKGDLASRLMAALLAGDRAGGDRRGRQSAAMLVVREGGGYLGDTDVVVDLRIDDHVDPVPELERLLGINRLLFPRPSELEFVPVDDALAVELGELLAACGYAAAAGATGYDETLRDALFDYVGTENLELRWVDEPLVERAVLESLRRR